MIAMHVLATFLPLLGAPPKEEWVLKGEKTVAPIRFMTKSEDRLLGGRVGGRPGSVEVWGSTDSGGSWSRVGTVAGPSATSAFGDVCFLSDGSSLVYSAFREHWGKHWQVSVYRSVDGGGSWTFDSVVASNDEDLFVGAPALHFSRDGNVQCYYDSEPVAVEQGQRGNQWIVVSARPKMSFGGKWDAYSGVASRPADPAIFARDGMPSVVDLPGSSMMLVCEGVDPADRRRNALYAILSHDNGRTWDYASRKRVWAPFKKGVQFNAYCPMAIRVGKGVGVAFCTDDDFAEPVLDSTPPFQRPTHVKYILGGLGKWGGLQTIEAGSEKNYAPGLFEISPGKVLATVDVSRGVCSVRVRG